ncbi:MAG: hypothetical protein AB1757_01470 [Acidobacteriota bacterium]
MTPVKSVGYYLAIVLVTAFSILIINCSKAVPSRNSRKGNLNNGAETTQITRQEASNHETSEIIQTLIPDDFAIDEEIDRFNRDEIIIELTKLEPQTQGVRALSVAYLLASLKHDYLTNQKKIVSLLQSCSREGINRIGSIQCEMATDYGIRLFEKGDDSLLNPLLDMGLVSDGDLAEMLGSFYADILQHQPEKFLLALQTRKPKEQRELAWLAGAEDGSGMPPETLSEVMISLERISEQKSNRLADTARRCLKEIEKVNHRINRLTNE